MLEWPKREKGVEGSSKSKGLPFKCGKLKMRFLLPPKPRSYATKGFF